MAPKDNSKRSKAGTQSHSDQPIPPAQHVWLAGLGAMAKAQEQGSKAIEALVNDGLAFQRKSQAEAQQRLHEATERMSHMATGFGQQATVRVDKLEHLFEDRVAKALHRLGMPSLLDIQMLTERVAQLESQLAAALKAPTSREAKAPAKTALKTGAKTGTKTVAKTAAKSVVKAPAKKTRAKSA